jgi:hypothetical protein
MSRTANLGLPFLAQQAQAHLSLNDGQARLDALVHLAVIDRDLATPPSTPAAGDVYLIAASGTGAWTSHSGQITVYYNGWLFLVPKEGWSCWVKDENTLLMHDGSAWYSPLPKRATMIHLDSRVLTGNALAREANYSIFGGRSYQSSPALNDEFTNSFYIRAGTYTLNVYGEEKNDRGIVTWSIDGVSQGTQDWYAVAQAVSFRSTSVTVLRDGYHKLNGKVASKNGSSGDYYMALGSMTLVPAAD